MDPNILTDLESHAKKVATCVDRMLENLSGTLQSVSSFPKIWPGMFVPIISFTLDL